MAKRSRAVVVDQLHEPVIEERQHIPIEVLDGEFKPLAECSPVDFSTRMSSRKTVQVPTCDQHNSF